jgi:glucose 1-dehydrogenase
MRLSGRIALITGASRGIGRSVALAFAREGAGIFLVGHHDESALQQTLQETRALGAEAEGFPDCEERPRKRCKSHTLALNLAN